MALARIYNADMEIVRHIYINEYHNRITLAIKDDEGATSIVRYEEGTAFDEKIVDLFIDVITFRLRFCKKVSPFLNSLADRTTAESKRAFVLLDKAFGLDRPYNIYPSKLDLARRDAAMKSLRAHLFEVYKSHSEEINGQRLY